MELRHGGPAKDLGVDRIGRKTNLTLDNLHISRDQLHFKLGVDVSGKAMLLMFNVRVVPVRPVPARRSLQFARS